MKTGIHRSNTRGYADHGWLQSHFSFSFAEYRDYSRMGFGALRVINDDTIAPGKGFSTHPHHNMEIVTLVTKGALEHKDSRGHHDTIHAGQIQHMSAGNGIAHSEYNPSKTDPVELLQIWIHPKSEGGAPQYAKRDFNARERTDTWMTLVSENGKERSMPIRQDATIRTCILPEGHTIASLLDAPGHGRLLFVIDGSITAAENRLDERDELQIEGDGELIIHAEEDSHLLLFDVPMR